MNDNDADKSHDEIDIVEDEEEEDEENDSVQRQYVRTSTNPSRKRKEAPLWELDSNDEIKGTNKSNLLNNSHSYPHIPSVGQSIYLNFGPYISLSVCQLLCYVCYISVSLCLVQTSTLMI
jgi:hypothetical protein